MQKKISSIVLSLALCTALYACEEAPSSTNAADTLKPVETQSPNSSYKPACAGQYKGKRRQNSYSAIQS
jgi:hypothetical protein